MDRLRHARTVALAIVLAAPAAWAEHDHAAHPTSHDEPGDRIAVTVGAIAASYHSMLFDGDYQGGSAGAAWAHGRFEIGGSFAAYRIERNGKAYRGFGDAMVHGHVTVVTRGAYTAGAMMMVMLPTGNDTRGLGMGHTMVMPALWGTVAGHNGLANVAIGYARGIGDESIHAQHGGSAWPLVEPMSFSEFTLDASAMLALAHGLHVGPRFAAALPTDADMRAIGGLRVGWRAGRVETTAEAQTGLVGDPVDIRGIVSTSVYFE